LTFAIQLARDAGAIIGDAVTKRHHGDATHTDVKADNPSDIVTETDRAVEEYIKARLTIAYPDHKFIGEESSENTVFTDDPTWIVDPIDGTNNFVHGYPCVAVSIGLTMAKEPVVGVVFNPLTNELYSAGRGLGAYLNETQSLPLFKAPLKDLSQCVVGTEVGSDRSPQSIDKKLAFMHQLVKSRAQGGKQALSIRATGSAAINMCSVAKGCLDVYWEVGCWEWDVCASIVIVQEAGG
ncbi:inositol monophosphatase, partial [Hesseltinella vesiculosa]